MVVLAFHLREDGERKIITTQTGAKHDITEYAKGVTWRGIQRVVDGELIDIGTPKSGKFDFRMSVYHGQA
jgi:surface antigen